MALEKTKALLLERVQFCTTWLENHQDPKKWMCRIVDTGKNIDKSCVSPQYYEGLNEFKNTKKDFNKGISAIVLLNSHRIVKEKVRNELINFLKTVIGEHIKKMIEIFGEQMNALETIPELYDKKEIEKRNKELRELNDCGVELLTLPKQL